MKNNKKVDLTKDVTMNFSVAEIAQIYSALIVQMEHALGKPVTSASLLKEVTRINKTKDNTTEDLKLLASMSALVRIDSQLRKLTVAAVEAKVITEEELDDAEKETAHA